MIPIGVLAAAGRGGVPIVDQTVLSAINIAGSLALLNPRTVEATTVNAGLVLSDTGKDEGRFYVEVRCTALHNSNQALAAGIKRGTSSLNNFLGQSSDEWGTWAEGTGGFTRSTYHAGTQGNASATAANALGQTARIAIDIDAGRLWLSMFGNPDWIGGGDPEDGSSPTFTFAPDGQFYYIALNPRMGGGSPTNRTRLQLTLPGSWLHQAPAGFGVWAA